MGRAAAQRPGHAARLAGLHPGLLQQRGAGSRATREAQCRLSGGGPGVLSLPRRMETLGPLRWPGVSERIDRHSRLALSVAEDFGRYYEGERLNWPVTSAGSWACEFAAPSLTAALTCVADLRVKSANGSNGSGVPVRVSRKLPLTRDAADGWSVPRATNVDEGPVPKCCGHTSRATPNGRFQQQLSLIRRSRPAAASLKPMFVVNGSLGGESCPHADEFARHRRFSYHGKRQDTPESTLSDEY